MENVKSMNLNPHLHTLFTFRANHTMQPKCIERTLLIMASTKKSSSKPSKKLAASSTLRVSVPAAQKEWVVKQAKALDITQAEFVQKMIAQAQSRPHYADLPDQIRETIREEIKKLQKNLQNHVFNAFNKNVDDVVDGVNDVVSKGRGFVQKVADKAKVNIN